MRDHGRMAEIDEVGLTAVRFPRMIVFREAFKKSFFRGVRSVVTAAAVSCGGDSPESAVGVERMTCRTRDFVKLRMRLVCEGKFLFRAGAFSVLASVPRKDESDKSRHREGNEKRQEGFQAQVVEIYQHAHLPMHRFACG